MKQAISYVRFSSHRQQGGTSVERQEKMIAEWLTSHTEYMLSALTFRDLGKSGFHEEHLENGGGFGELLFAIEQGAIKAGDVVLVEALDRAGRLQPLDMITKVIAPILNAGVAIITLDDNTEYTKQSVGGPQLFLLAAKIQAAHQYSETLSRRVTASYDKRRKQALEGVTPKRMTPVWLNSDGSVREDVAPWIKEAFELYVSGMGKSTIAKRMRESGVERLAKCSGPSVEGWLRNEAAIGRWNGNNVYPAIIEPALFYKAQIHAEKVKTQRPVKTAKHFLVGLVKCGSCGKNYIIQNKDGKPHSMRCRIRQNLKGCDNSHIVPKPVIEAIYRWTSTQAAWDALTQQQMSVNAKEIVTKEAELLDLNKKVDEVADVVVKLGGLPELVTRLEAMKASREALESELTILRKTEDSTFTMHWSQAAKIEDFKRDDPQRLAAMLRSVGYEIVVNDDGRITTSGSESAIYRYGGVDRKSGMYKVMRGDKMQLVHKLSYNVFSDEHDEWYGGDDSPAESVWLEEDYKALQDQHK
ncbi:MULTISPECIES: recombinase family protein [unclassified Pseudomonas]|uniref:recombinase family protein n=1 Tax=unclassified Pseudomonas TaxID=196821 RepID=UPI000A1EE1B5|nr:MULTISPECIES: recombinase family protein [unclassified Pseudomonas]